MITALIISVAINIAFVTGLLWLGVLLPELRDAHSWRDFGLTELLREKMPEHRIVNAGVTAYGTDQEYLVLRRLWDRIKPNVVVLMVCVDNDRKENTVNTRSDGPYKPYFQISSNGGEFKGMPVPWSRHLYFADNWFARHSWVVRVAVSAYVLIANPQVTVPDPTERLISERMSEPG